MVFINQDYLYINKDFQVLARSSTIRYGRMEGHGRLVAGAMHLQKALELAAQVLKNKPSVYTHGVRVSEGAVAKARVMEEEALKKKAEQSALDEEILMEYAAGYYHGGF